MIEIELRVDARSRAAWQIVVLHERRLVFKGLRRPSADGYSLKMRRTAPDWPGREAVTARMQKAGGPSCRLTATI